MMQNFTQVYGQKNRQKEKEQTMDVNHFTVTTMNSFITKTCLYNVDPLTPLFIVKLWFTGVYIIFSNFYSKIDCGYSLEPHRGGSNGYSQSIF